MNWAVGNVGSKDESSRTPDEPFGIFESHNLPVQPRSLYYAQLRDRLGTAALNQIILPSQKTGTLWDELKAWAGDGLFRKGVVANYDDSDVPVPGVPVALTGIIRDLKMRQDFTSVTWSKVAGPGAVGFSTTSMLESEVTFGQPGRYTIGLLVSDGTRQLTSSTGILVGQAGDTTPPAPIAAGLTATAGFNAVTLDWPPSPEIDFDTYSVYRRDDGDPFTTPLATGLNRSEFLDTTAANGTTYHYVVTATDSNGNESLFGNEVTSHRNFAFLQNFQGLGGSDPLTFTLSDGNLSETLTHTVDPSQYPGTLFGGAARIRNGFEVDFDTFATSVPVPDTEAPSAPALVSATPDDKEVTLTWNASPADDVASYSVYRRSGGGAFSDPIASGLGSLTFSDPAVLNGTSYQYAVIATDVGGNESPLSAELSATPSADLDGDGIDDSWEGLNFGSTGAIDGTADSDGDGIADFFEFIYGADPNDADSLGQPFLVSRDPATGEAVFTWAVPEDIILGTHYLIGMSTNLEGWMPLPGDHYTLDDETTDGTTSFELRLTHDDDPSLFLRLSRP